MTRWWYLTCDRDMNWVAIRVNSAEERSAIVELINTSYKSEKAKLNKNAVIEISKDVWWVSVCDALGQRGWELVGRQDLANEYWHADFKRALEE